MSRKWSEKDMQDVKIPELLGSVEFGKVIGFDRRKMAVYLRRNKLPAPITKAGNRSFWTREQVDKFAEDYKQYKTEKEAKRIARLGKPTLTE